MLMDIRYGENIIVAVVFQGRWHWYVSEKERWFLDQEKFAEAFIEAGYEDTYTSHSDTFGIAVVDTDNATFFLDKMQPYKVGTTELSDELLSRLPVNTGEDIVEMVPALLVHFDDKQLLSQFPEPASFEEFVPDGWTGEEKVFLDKIPESQRFWIINGHDYFKDFLEN